MRTPDVKTVYSTEIAKQAALKHNNLILFASIYSIVLAFIVHIHISNQNRFEIII